MDQGWKGKLVNFVWFQTIWFCAIVFENQFLWLMLFLIVGYIAVLPCRLQSVIFGVAIGLYGVLVDGTLAALGFYQFSAEVSALIPLWLVVLWVAFGYMLRISLTYLRDRYLLAAFLGAVSGPLSYFAAAKLGAVTFLFPTAMTLVVIAFIWAFTVPLWLYIDVWQQKRFAPIQYN
ncbi:DUF2878 domain-containing protein [Alteromonas sp. C1M14]|uniref:DUF2878 domain-containing protein n=1 Tax=Alteromonas sp. C1M14 TaxID=2841567 RepID=UPI001C08B391|nr:DUF2878 domain-containing protein [Alteromonas sp. C1M14]MBU2977005.1 DUF2878 domain-containing protein [Alteromonas sp. C1M14]